MMECERPYYRDLKCRPFLFYVMFGVKNEELRVSRKRHHVDGFPDGLELVFCDRKKNDAYMRSLMGDSLGRILDREKHDLYEIVKETDQWAVIRGEVCQDSDLKYMQNTIGFIQALIDNGAVGVLDLQTLSLYSSAEWSNRFFEREWNPYDHVTILASEMEDGLTWLHTRGMRKFGRPDIGVWKVAPDESEEAVQVINQMIYYGSLGAFFEREVRFHTQSGNTYLVNPHFVADYENPDFNNAYYRFEWRECKPQKSFQ